MLKKGKLIGLLACLNCKSKLFYVNDDNVLCCPDCNMKYVIKNKVPIMATKHAQDEIDSDIRTADGVQMLNEFNKDSFLYKIYDFGKKIISSDFGCSNHIKKMKTMLLGEEMILEIGAGNRRLNDKVINFDIVCFPNTDVIGDAHKLPFVDGVFDVVWLEMVLEHVRNPQRVSAEVFRVLKPGGYVLAMTPFIMPFHGYPGDYYRFTMLGLEELFNNYRKVDCGVYKGASVAIVNNISDYFALFSFSKNRIIYFILKAIVLCLTLPLKYLDILLINNQEAHKLANALFYLGRK